MSEMDRDQLVARIVRFGKEYLRLLIRVPSVDPLSEEFGRLVVEEGVLINEFADDIEDHGEYEARMDELLCRLTNGKLSKSRSYSVDSMISCIDEAYEEAYAGDSATAGGGKADMLDGLEGMDNLVTMLREAADTIESLRDRLLKAERACDEKSYDAGFDNGMKAVLQQLDGLIHEGADVDEIQAWADRQWEEEA